MNIIYKSKNVFINTLTKTWGIIRPLIVPIELLLIKLSLNSGLYSPAKQNLLVKILDLYRGKLIKKEQLDEYLITYFSRTTKTNSTTLRKRLNTKYNGEEML